MNNTIETILNHRSIRSFTDQLLTAEEIDILVKSAQAASTSSYVQAYSIIGVSDPEKKRELSVLAGNQPYVENNGHFLYFARTCTATKNWLRKKAKIFLSCSKIRKCLWLA